MNLVYDTVDWYSNIITSIVFYLWHLAPVSITYKFNWIRFKILAFQLKLNSNNYNDDNKELTLSAKAFMTSFAALHLAASSLATNQLSSIFCWHSCILWFLSSHCSSSLLAYPIIWNSSIRKWTYNQYITKVNATRKWVEKV